MSTKTLSFDKDQREYLEHRIGTFKNLGGIQIIFGTLCGIMSFSGIIADILKNPETCDNNRDCNYESDNRCCTYSLALIRSLLMFDISCLVLSGWFLVNGHLPLRMQKKEQESWKCLKKAYIVMCFVSLVVAPIVCGLGVAGCITRPSYDGSGLVFSILIVTTSFVEIVIAIVAVSIRFCYSTSGDMKSSTVILTETPHLVGVAALPSSQSHNRPQYKHSEESQKALKESRSIDTQ